MCPREEATRTAWFLIPKNSRASCPRSRLRWKRRRRGVAGGAVFAESSERRARPLRSSSFSWSPHGSGSKRARPGKCSATGSRSFSARGSSARSPSAACRSGRRFPHASWCGTFGSRTSPAPRRPILPELEGSRSVASSARSSRGASTLGRFASSTPRCRSRRCRPAPAADSTFPRGSPKPMASRRRSTFGECCSGTRRSSSSTATRARGSRSRTPMRTSARASGSSRCGDSSIKASSASCRGKSIFHRWQSRPTWEPTNAR